MFPMLFYQTRKVSKLGREVGKHKLESIVVWTLKFNAIFKIWMISVHTTFLPFLFYQFVKLNSNFSLSNWIDFYALHIGGICLFLLQ